MRRNPLLVTAGVLVLTVTAVVAVKFVRDYETPASAGSPPAAAAPDATDGDTGDGNPSASPSADLPGDAAQQARFQAAAELVQKAKGHLGIVVHDRTSGAEWRAGEVDYSAWA